MKLTEEALAKINALRIRRELCRLFDRTEFTIVRYIRENRNDGPLTKQAALDLIAALTGLPADRITTRTASTTARHE